MTPTSTDATVSPNELAKMIGPRGTVLLIEPDADVARMLEVRLAREGYDVLMAETGQGGQYLVDQHTVDLILLDRNLNDASLELLQQLRSTPNPCEVIMMTADPTVEIFVEALDAGAFDLVVKPFSNLKLVTSKVRNAVAKVQAERTRDELAAKLDAFESAEVPTLTGAAETGDASDDPTVVSDVDPVTQLPSWRAAERRFAEETSRALRYDRPMTIILLSVDKLETVIEIAGSEAMDQVLHDLSQLLRGQVRDVDYLARRQGGEFMLLLPETQKPEGAVVAERIRQRLESANLGTLNAGDIRLTASFGLAGLPADTMNAELLRQAAEVALTRAQASGNLVISYDGHR